MKTIVSIIGIIFLLYVGRPLLLPLITATFLWYLSSAISAYYKKLVRSALAANLLAGASILGVLYLFLTQIKPMFVGFFHRVPEMAAGIEKLLAKLSEMLGTEITFDNSHLPSLQEILTNIGTSLVGGGTVLAMILIYLLFIFAEQGTFTNKLRALFPSKKQFSKVSFIIKSIDSRMKQYLFVKTIMSVLTGVFSYIWLAILGVDFAIVWAFIIFILNYIPTIGSIAGGLLPTLYVFAITGEFQTPILVALGITLVNIVVSNILDPKLTGKTLHLSTMAILINLVFWGMIWGPIGMFFSVPILAMIYVVAAQFDRTRWIAVLLSADGRIPDKNE